MKLYRWRIHDEITGKLYEARWMMTEEDAYKRDPMAEKIPGSEFEPSPVGSGAGHATMDTRPITGPGDERLK